MVLLFALLASIFGYCLFIFQKTNVKIEETPIITVSLLVMVLYVTALMNLLIAGVYIVLAGGLCLLALTLIQKRKELGQFLRSVMQPGMVMFILGAPVIFLLSKHIIFSNWDEFSHWGLVVKAMNIAGALPGKDSMLQFPAYPPGTALFQFFFCRLLGDAEGVVVFAHVFIVWAAAIAFTKGLNWKQLLWVLLALFAVCIGYIHFSNSLWCIYVDGILGLLLGSAFALYYSTQARAPSDIFKTIPLLAFIALIKQSGVFLSILFCLLMMTDQWNLSIRTKGTQGNNHSPGRHAYALAVALAFILPIIVNISWAIHLSAAGMSHDQGLFGGALPGAMAGVANTGVISAFAKALTSTAIGLTRPALGFFTSALALTMLIVFSTGLLTLITPDKPMGKRVLRLIGILLLDLIVYCIGLILIYMLSFSAYEGNRLASYGRYMSTFFLPIILCLFRILFTTVVDRQVKPKARKISMMILAVLLLFLVAVTPLGLLNVFSRKTSNMDRTKIAAATTVIKSLSNDTDRVYIIWENTTGLNYWMTRYDLYPIETNANLWSIGLPYSSKDIWTGNISAEDWANTLNGYRYVYIGKADEPFAERYKKLFANQMVKSDTVYAVNTGSDGVVQLEPIDAAQ